MGLTGDDNPSDFSAVLAKINFLEAKVEDLTGRLASLEAGRGIVAVAETGEVTSEPFIMMEPAEGLGDWLSKGALLQKMAAVCFILVFALGGMLAGMAGVIAASALSIAPGTDLQFLLSSLVVVIVGGMGSVGGAALGALLVGLAEQYGLAYAPTYGVVFTFAIMVLVLAVRPQGLLGKAER